MTKKDSRVEQDRHYSHRGYGYRLLEAERMLSDEDLEDDEENDFYYDSKEQKYIKNGFQIRGKREV